MKKNIACRLLAATLVLPAMSFGALACSPVKVHTVYFDVNSSSVSNLQLQKLSEWTNWLKKNYANRQWIGTEVTVETAEKDQIQLGWNRELAVRLALIDLDFTAPAFGPSEQIWVRPPQPASIGGGIRSRSVYLNFLPDCPHECPCQIPSAER